MPNFCKLSIDTLSIYGANLVLQNLSYASGLTDNFDATFFIMPSSPVKREQCWSHSDSKPVERALIST